MNSVTNFFIQSNNGWGTNLSLTGTFTYTNNNIIESNNPANGNFTGTNLVSVAGGSQGAAFNVTSNFMGNITDPFGWKWIWDTNGFWQIIKGAISITMTNGSISIAGGGSYSGSGAGITNLPLGMIYRS